MAKLRLTLTKSLIGRKAEHIATASSGLKRIGNVVEHEDSPQVKGMINKINYLVKTEEV